MGSCCCVGDLAVVLDPFPRPLRPLGSLRWRWRADQHHPRLLWQPCLQALRIQRLGLGVRGLRLPSHCCCSTQHLLWRLLQLPVLSWLLNILNIQIFKIFFTASKQLMKFLGLLVCSPKGAKDILFPWLSDYPNDHTQTVGQDSGQVLSQEHRDTECMEKWKQRDSTLRQARPFNAYFPFCPKTTEMIYD